MFYVHCYFYGNGYAFDIFNKQNEFEITNRFFKYLSSSLVSFCFLAYFIILNELWSSGVICNLQKIGTKLKNQVYL